MVPIPVPPGTCEINPISQVIKVVSAQAIKQTLFMRAWIIECLQPETRLQALNYFTLHQSLNFYYYYYYYYII
jgi:hypothetical protein